jgi:hypothetical protein
MTAKHMKKFIFPLLALAVSLIMCVILGDILIRIFFSHPFRTIADERNLMYAYHEELGWFPQSNSQRDFIGGQTIFVQHNNQGFRDHKHGEKTEPRIVFLGDSFVWGYDVEQHQRFTEKLQKRIPAWEVINLGISGYGTDQAYLLFQQHVDFYQPEIVCLIFCQNNDKADNMANLRYGYYKPYFLFQEGKLQLQGVPVTKSWSYHYMQHPLLFKSYLTRAFVKTFLLMTRPRIAVPDPTRELLLALQRHAELSGSAFFIGFQKDNGDLQEFCREEAIPFASFPDAPHYRDIAEHWTPEGHTYVSDVLYEFLTTQHFLSPS